jgi:hypothetical protein
MITVETIGRLVPGPAAAGVRCLAANNNLDLVRFAGRLWFAWRTAPSHFASADARLEVSSAPGVEGPWRHETTIALGADVREPRWVVADDHLELWFLRLGTDPKRFQPRGVHRVTTDGTRWSEPACVLPEGVVPWRVRRLRGRWALIGYRGAERMYSARPADPVVEVRWSDDLDRWDPPIDVHPGGTECELVELLDGRLLGITRNEGPTRRGGDLLVGPDLAHLHVTPLARKPDSPNLFLWEGEPFLLARRQVAHGGRYDHVPSWFPGSLAIRADQAVWSLTRKRSTLYRVDPDQGTITPEIDLPSRGDTSFAAVVPEPDGSMLVADYTSPEAGGDHMWLRGQLRPTVIELHRLRRS